MKKIGVLIKEASENQIQHYLKQTHSFFIIRYSGLSSPDLTTLRMSLKQSKADLFVVKNSVARRALANAGRELALKNIEGPCGLVFIQEEAVDVSKTIFHFLKEHEQLKVEGGFLRDKFLEKKDIEALSKLPSKEVLRTQLVVTLNSPISGFVVTLKNTLRKFVVCLEKIKEKKTA